jgi:hypothetical protein
LRSQIMDVCESFGGERNFFSIDGHKE